jgi:hypothetical protein
MYKIFIETPNGLYVTAQKPLAVLPPIGADIIIPIELGKTLIFRVGSIIVSADTVRIISSGPETQDVIELLRANGWSYNFTYLT